MTSILRTSLCKMSGLVRCGTRGLADYSGGLATERCVNQVTLLGRVGKDPEVRGSAERPAIIFSLATNTFSKSDPSTGDVIQRTDWHRIAVFKPGVRDNVERYLSRGSRVLVQGRITYDKFQDQYGHQVRTTTIVADDVLFLTKGRERQSEEEAVNA